jgi:hypothetical protein
MLQPQIKNVPYCVNTAQLCFFSQHMLQKWSVHVVGLEFKCFRPVILLSSSFFTDVVGLDLNCFSHLYPPI